MTITVTPVAEVVNAGVAGDSDHNGTADLTMMGDHVYAVAGKEDAWFALGTNYAGTSNTTGGYALTAGWAGEGTRASLPMPCLRRRWNPIPTAIPLSGRSSAIPPMAAQPG